MEFYARLKESFTPYSRLNTILATALKYGFGEFVETLVEKKHIKLPKFLEDKLSNQPRGVRLRLMFVELGPTFIKLGQMLSMRKDILPPDITEELEKLQDRVQAASFKEIESELRDELKRPLKELFKEIDPEPLAAASIGQVYKAKLKGGGDVIIKIKRPEVERIIEADIVVLTQLARLIEKHFKESQFYQPKLIVKEFARNIRHELDYKREARNAEKFRKDFNDDNTVFIPKVYWNLTTKNVIVEEFVKGRKISEIRALDASTRRLIAERSALFFTRQILYNGFFNADPHPGNLFLMKGNVIGVVDFGMVGAIDFELKELLQTIFVALVEKDIDAFIENFNKVLVFSPETSRQDFSQDFLEIIEEYYGLSLSDIKIQELIEDIITTCRQHNVRIDSRMLLLLKMLATIESFEREIYPNFKTIEMSKPIVKQIISEQMKPTNILTTISKHARAYSKLLAKLPERITQLLEQTEEGRLKIEFEHVGLDNVVFKLDRTINKISISLMVSALIVGSSLLMFANVGPKFYGISAVGIIGMTIAFFFGTILLLSILSSREI